MTQAHSKFILVGWQDTLKEENTTKDLVIYETNHKGKLLSKQVIGTLDKDEIGTGITMAGADYFAISLYTTTSFLPTKFSKVKSTDRLSVLLFDLAGNLVWTYNHTSTENGLAPVDIKFQNDEIYVLANENLGGSSTGVRVLKLNMNGQLTSISPQHSTNNNHIWASELELMNGVVSTIGNDNIAKHPHLVTLNTSLQLTSSIPLVNNVNDFLFGFVVDSNTNIYTAVGYTLVENGDTNALIHKLDPGFNVISTKILGTVGVEKFRDIGTIGDGFIASGVRNNKGNGGYDNYISHLTFNLDTLMEQTDGGPTNERNSSIIILEDLNSAYMTGHNIQYGVQGSGNSYVLGVMSFNAPNSFNYGCDIPRIVMIDKLLDVNNNMMPNLQNYQTTIDNAISKTGANIIFLYDVDYLFDKWKVLPANDARAVRLQKLLDYAHDVKNLTIGLIIGPSRSKVIRVADAVDGKTRYNYDHSAKINLVMLEQEFWTCSYEIGLSISEFNHNNSSSFVFPSGRTYDPAAAVTSTSTLGNPFFNVATSIVVTDADKDAFYRILVEDHYDMLQTLRNRQTHTTNLWKSFDYIGYIKNFNTLYSPKHYSEVLGSSNNPALSDYDFRQSYAKKTRPITSGTFLTYYRNGNLGSTHMMANGDINFAFSDPSSNFTNRLRGLAENSGWSNIPLNVIPLQSAENYSCGQTDFLGNWLGGNNRPNIAELNYADQYRDNFKPNETLAANEINHIANGWFKFSCMDNKTYSLSGNDPFSSFHERFNCTVFHNPISINEETISSSFISAFPNPFNSSIVIEVTEHNLNESNRIQVFNSTGQIIYQNDFKQERVVIETSSWLKGIYIIKVSNNTEDNYNDVFIKN